VFTGDAKPIKSPSKGGGGKPPKAAAAGQKRSRAADSPGGGEGAAPPPGPLLARLRLLLRFIPALCRYDQVPRLFQDRWIFACHHGILHAHAPGARGWEASEISGDPVMHTQASARIGSI